MNILMEPDLGPTKSNMKYFENNNIEKLIDKYLSQKLERQIIVYLI